MAGGYEVANIVNQALDACMWPEMVGDIEEGTHQAQVALRAYGECLKQMLRAAPWDFARAQAPLTLLADASGNTPNVGTAVPLGWIYEYSYPTDCAKMRFIPGNWDNQASVIPPGNIQIPATPLLTGVGNQPVPMRIVPARFLLTRDRNYPPLDGQQTWAVQGVSVQGRTVVLTNVRNAQAIYTSIPLYPSEWDSLFRGAMVAYLASEIAGPIWAKKDPKMGLQMRDRQIPIVKAKLDEARLTSANEAGYPQTTDIPVDWMRGRRVGGGYGNNWNNGFGGDGPDVFGYGNDSLSPTSGASF